MSTLTQSPIRTAFELEPDIARALKHGTEAERLAALATIRRELNIPAGGQELRAWIRYNLQLVTHPKTGRPWNQADIGREAAEASPTHVSRVFLGGFPKGRHSRRIREVTARVLGLPVEAIWTPPAPTCRECGAPIAGHGEACSTSTNNSTGGNDAG